MSTNDTSVWWNNNITIEDIMNVCKKLAKKHREYTYSFCIGFVDTTYLKEDGDTHVWVSTKYAPKQNDKPWVLMKAGCSFHKKLLKLEEEEDIHFERLTDDTMRKINERTLLVFTNEDGTYRDLFKFEPIYKPLSLSDLPIGFYPKLEYFSMVINNPII